MDSAGFSHPEVKVFSADQLSIVDSIRHPEFLEKAGFRPEFTPLQNGAGMTTFWETVRLWTDS